MTSEDVGRWLVCAPIILGLVYWSSRGWKKLMRDTGMDIAKKLKRDASLIGILENADEQVAFRRERIRSLRDRARTDPCAARDLRRLLEIHIGSGERVLQELQAPNDSASVPIESAKSALMRDILEWRRIQQETNHLPDA